MMCRSGRPSRERRMRHADIGRYGRRLRNGPVATPEPGRATLEALSLGAGVQSTTVLLLAVEGRIPAFDVAMAADTGRDARRTCTHLARARTGSAAQEPQPVSDDHHGAALVEEQA